MIKHQKLAIDSLEYKEEFGDLNRYECQSFNFVKCCNELQSNYPYIWLSDIFVQYFNETPFIISTFTNMETGEILSLQYKMNDSKNLVSIAHLWRNASVYEQEIYDLYGFNFSQKYKRQYFAETSGFPLGEVKEEIVPKGETLNSDLTLQLSNSLVRNHTNVFLNMRKNLVDRCELQRGHYHIGLESICENISLKETYSFIESYFALNGLNYAELISRGFEEHYKVDIPDRAKSIRMVLLELSRVAHHYQFLLKVSSEFKLESVYSQVQLAIKKIQSLLVSYCGNEFLSGVIRFGGVTKDTSQVWLSRVLSEITWLEGSLVNIYKNVFVKETVKQTLNIDMLSKRQAAAWGVTGPLARCVGLNIDYRKINPIYFYQDVDFEIPVGVKGSTYDAIMVNLEEILQSFKVIIQVLDNLPTGKLISKDIESYRSLKENGNGEDESRYRESIDKDLSLNDTSFITATEGNNGFQGIFLDYKMKQNQRIRFINPSSINAALFNKVAKDKEVNCIIPYWISMGINLKEAER